MIITIFYPEHNVDTQSMQTFKFNTSHLPCLHANIMTSLLHPQLIRVHNYNYTIIFNQNIMSALDLLKGIIQQHFNNTFHAGHWFFTEQNCVCFLTFQGLFQELLTNTRHVSSYLNAFLMVIPNMVMKFNIFDIFLQIC